MIYLDKHKICSRLLYCLSVIFFLTKDFKGVGGLRCWKCIAHDCDLDPEDNYRATKVDCKGGNQQCMKVQYRMFDNVTHYDSVIRTCTDRPCHATSMDNFYKCVATPKQYMIGGCTLRKCCSDRDYCNGAETARIKLWALNGALPFILIVNAKMVLCFITYRFTVTF